MVGRGVADLHGLINKFSERINPNLATPSGYCIITLQQG